MLTTQVGSNGSLQSSIPVHLFHKATKIQRKFIIKIAKTTGCHICGTRKTAKWIADHQPPSGLLKKFLTTKTPLKKHIFCQRLYPQCIYCSNIQSQAIRNLKYVDYISYFQ